MPKTISKRNISYMYILSAMAFWGIATPVIKATVSEIPPFTFLMLRFWLAAIITLPLTIYYIRKINFGKVRFQHILVAALIGQVVTLSLFFLGLERTDATNAAIIGTVSPLLTSILGFFILKEIITRREIEGTLIALIGTLVIIFEPIINGHSIFNGGRLIMIGNIVFFTGVVLDSFYTIYLKKRLSSDYLISPIMLAVITTTIAAIAFTPLGIYEQHKLYTKSVNILPECTVAQVDKYIYDAGYICDSSGCFDDKETKNYFCSMKSINQITFFENLQIQIKNYLQPPYIYGVLYMAIISGIIGYAFFYRGLQNIEASEASVFTYMQPLFAIPIAIVFLGESLNPIFLLGALIIAIGIYLAEKRAN